MIPLTIAEDIRTTLLDYLITTFNFQDPAVEQALLDFFVPSDTQEKTDGLFKGPYISLRLPFRKADPAAGLPLEICPAFTPYAHQVKSFERLSSINGHQPQPTLVTTGTGSGKTECFLYPILDYCYAHRGEPGIKAIILYPMNALASDQSGRLAHLLWDDERLNGQITAGMYIGGDGEQPHTTMGPDHLIDERNTLRKRPPDILLTNYRMLDFLLLRPEDKTLWAENTSETLRFLVLDELHTYDGAQGSDVACLIRRLKARLHIPDEFLCPVGTSATVASDHGDTRQLLTAYAEQIFGVAFEPESVIVEDRLDLDTIFPNSAKHDSFPQTLDVLNEINGEDYESYIRRQLIGWFGEELDPVSLAEELRGHNFLRTLLIQLSDTIMPLKALISRLVRWDPIFAGYNAEEQGVILQSFLALVSHARVKEGVTQRPFLTCQVQLWVREISRLMREVSAVPTFFWRDDVPLSSERRGLPTYYCRECGHTGWLAYMRDGDDYLVDDLKTLYPAYFSHSKHLRYIYPRSITNLVEDEDMFVCPSCMTVSNETYCKACRKDAIAVHLYIETSIPKDPKQQPIDMQRCPLCGTDGALSLVGSQAASLSSVAISHLYTTPLNQDKKLLAFTDSVQDASHRASFFEARTYRFSLRTAIQGALQNDQSVQLDKLTDQVLDHWHEVWKGLKNCNQRLAATFIPPDLRDLPVYSEYMEYSQKINEEGDIRPIPIPHDLDRVLHQRVSWEITMEYGFNARVGRSLEKVGSSVAYLDPVGFNQIVQDLVLILPEEIGFLAGLQLESLRYFLLGLVERTRVRGGVFHPLLDSYAHDQGNWFLLTKKIQPLLSPFHKNSPRFPRFLTDSSDRDVFDLFVASGSRRTWYVDWAQKTLGENLGLAEINEIYRTSINLLAKNGVLFKLTKGMSNSYGIDPKILWVTNHAAIVKCNQCGHKHTIAAQDIDQWLNHACISYRCRGFYSEITQPTQHYYKEVYQRGQVERIFAHEHTGLLKRETREKVENQFKHQTRADSTNLLTATPTLELGIDIGDLSSTMACSVPPAPTNYLQRIGRAGRKTGNSLILTLANAQPHDLYFFEDPMEMISGSIIPPGCYLDAPDMLKRQFLAFCMDTWTGTDPKATLLPRNVQKMLAGINKGGFPENLLVYFENNRQDLIDRFLEIFKAVVSSENQIRLSEYLSGNTLPTRVRASIHDIEVEREELRTARKKLKARFEKLEADPVQFKEPGVELKRLEQDMALLLDMIKQIEDQYSLNFFTDAGLLPNYAFPETGVRLTGVISGLDQPHSDHKSYMLKEYVRSAPVALREIAPFNHFYAEGRKLTVSHIDVAGREKAIERWQFCDKCSHMELVQASHYSAVCPVCGSTMWSDHGQMHNMILFRKATAYVEDYKSHVGDDNDDREREIYQTSHFFEMEPNSSRGAYLLPKLPFGIEYMDQVTLREINFGLANTVSQKINIAGEERPEQGFKTCRDCGVTIGTISQPDGPKHTRNCASSTSAESLEWDNIYLYRTMTSEAIRILLPVSTTLIGEKMATFEACLDLGLRKKFHGNPAHLHILTHIEPADDGNNRRYLVIYDSVPGGTGFLKDLARPDNFFEVLQLALESLVSCKCRQTPEKQACYRCLYSYRVQRELKLISRLLGIEMLSEILSQKDQLEMIPSLSHAHIDNLIESELEQRLIHALDKYCKGNSDRSFQSIIHNGKQAWELKIAQTHWILEPQVFFGPTQQVWSNSRADFVFWPQSKSSSKPVVVFTDGFAYHVKPEQHEGGIADDIIKRRALIDTEKYIVWSIVWDDIKAFENDENIDSHFFSHSQLLSYEQLLSNLNGLFQKNLIKMNAVEQLLTLLSNPDHTSWTQAASFLALASLQPLRPMIEEAVLLHKNEEMHTSIVFPDLTIPSDTPSGDYFYNITSKGSNHLLVWISKISLSNKKSEEFSATLRLEDNHADRNITTFRQDWHHFWLFSNILQFLPGFKPTSAEYIQLSSNQVKEAQFPSIPSDEWEETYQYASIEVHPLLRVCQSSQKSIPIVGYELMGDDSKIIAFAELAWEPLRIAVLLLGQENERSIFEQSGWRIFTPEDQDILLKELD